MVDRYGGKLVVTQSEERGFIYRVDEDSESALQSVTSGPIVAEDVILGDPRRSRPADGRLSTCSREPKLERYSPKQVRNTEVSYR